MRFGLFSNNESKRERNHKYIPCQRVNWDAVASCPATECRPVFDPSWLATRMCRLPGAHLIVPIVLFLETPTCLPMFGLKLPCSAFKVYGYSPRDHAGGGRNHSYRAPRPKPRRRTFMPSALRASWNGEFWEIASPGFNQPSLRATPSSWREAHTFPPAKCWRSQTSRSAAIVSSRFRHARVGFFWRSECLRPSFLGSLPAPRTGMSCCRRAGRVCRCSAHRGRPSRSSGTPPADADDTACRRPQEPHWRSPVGVGLAGISVPASRALASFAACIRA